MIVVALVFGVLFALALVAPVSDLVALPPYYAQLGMTDFVPWPILIVDVVIPVVLYVVALRLGRRRTPFERALILTVALALSFALYFGAYELVLQLQPAVSF
jgi:hypothetical protein